MVAPIGLARTAQRPRTRFGPLLYSYALAPVEDMNYFPGRPAFTLNGHHDFVFVIH
jgi:hypothetical protein